MSLGRRDLQRIGLLPFGRLGQPIAVGQAPGMGAGGRCFPRQRVGELLLARRDLLRPAALLMAQPQPLLGGIEQRSEQLPLPVVPGGRTNRADIDHRQDQEEAQPLGALHRRDEILDRLGIG